MADQKCNYGHTNKGGKGLEADDDIVNFVCDMLAQRFHKGQIKKAIREELAADISLPALECLITTAKKRIRDRYKIDATEYKGYLVAELERLLRAKTPTKYRLKIIHELADLLGLRAIADQETPQEYAKKVAEAIRQMDGSVDGTLIEGKTNVSQKQREQAKGDRPEERKGEPQA